MKLPKWPKGLRSRLAKLERKEAQKKAVADRKKEIAALKSKVKTLSKKLSK